ncbi:MAG TPA: hypothetical protein VGR45_00710, partial [Stellaceae bacterium]|nr:hypothetical protein [Stellaceae bacterium]
MADSLSISITADTASLTAQMARAQADVRAYAAEVRRLATELRGAGSDKSLELSLEAAAGKLASAQRASASLRSELRSGLRPEASGAAESLNLLTEGGKKLAEAFGVGLSLEGLTESVEKLAELGEQTKNTAAAIGVAPEEFSRLSGAMQLVGGDGETATRTLQILGSRMEQALAEPTSKARQAFEALGISEQQLRDGLQNLPGF